MCRYLNTTAQIAVVLTVLARYLVARLSPRPSMREAVFVPLHARLKSPSLSAAPTSTKMTM